MTPLPLLAEATGKLTTELMHHFAWLAPEMFLCAMVVIVLLVDIVRGRGRDSGGLFPAITLAGPYVAYIARLMRTSMLEVLHQDFVRTARAKGVSETRIIYQHALKVAILPVVSFLGPLAANLLTGSLVPGRLGANEALRLLAFVLLLTAAVVRERQVDAGISKATALAERRRVARDLHDGIAQDLAFIAAHGSVVGDRDGGGDRVAGLER